MIMPVNPEPEDPDATQEFDPFPYGDLSEDMARAHWPEEVAIVQIVPEAAEDQVIP
jgi:hypothetical protein